MNTTNTKAKVELAKLVLEIEDPTVIEKIHRLVMQEGSDFWMRLSKEEKKEIKLGISQLDRGEKVSFERYIEKVR